MIGEEFLSQSADLDVITTQAAEIFYKHSRRFSLLQLLNHIGKAGAIHRNAGDAVVKKMNQVRVAFFLCYLGKQFFLIPYAVALAVHVTQTVQELAFDNKLAGSIVLSKKVEGEATGEEFTFSFTFTDGSGTQLTEKFAYTGSRTGEVGSGDTLKLKDGESVVFDSVPVGTICTVTEESRARYTTTVNAASTSSIRFSVTSESMPIAFVNTLVTTKFTVTKEWQGGDGGAITLTLYANGQKLDP